MIKTHMRSKNFRESDGHWPWNDIPTAVEYFQLAELPPAMAAISGCRKHLISIQPKRGSSRGPITITQRMA